eukprot:4144211-Amphidinium_carterae.1
MLDKGSGIVNTSLTSWAQVKKAVADPGSRCPRTIDSPMHGTANGALTFGAQWFPPDILSH